MIYKLQEKKSNQFRQYSYNKLYLSICPTISVSFLATDKAPNITVRAIMHANSRELTDFSYHKESPFFTGFGKFLEGVGALMRIGRGELGKINDGN